MACIAGRLSRLEVSTDDITYVDVGNLVSATMNMNIDELECTVHQDNGARTYIPGHHDATVDGSLRWDQDDAGQTLVRGAVFTKTELFYRFRIETGAGRVEYKGTGFATSFSPSTDLDDTANIDFTIRMSGLSEAIQP